MSDSTSTTEMKDSTKTVRTDRPKSISGLTSHARDEAVREKRARSALASGPKANAEVPHLVGTTDLLLF